MLTADTFKTVEIEPRRFTFAQATAPSVYTKVNHPKLGKITYGIGRTEMRERVIQFLEIMVVVLFLSACGGDDRKSQKGSDSSKQVSAELPNRENQTPAIPQNLDKETFLIRAEALEKELFRRTQFKSEDRSAFPKCYFDVFMEGVGGGRRQGVLIGQSFSLVKRIHSLLDGYESTNQAQENKKRVNKVRNSETVRAVKSVVDGFEEKGMKIKYLDEPSLLHEEAAALTYYILDEIGYGNLSKPKVKFLQELHTTAKRLLSNAKASGLTTQVIENWEQESLEKCISYTQGVLNSLK